MDLFSTRIKTALAFFILQIKAVNFDDRKLEVFGDAVNKDAPDLASTFASKISGFPVAYFGRQLDRLSLEYL